jgi:predicted outer membrane repeat protein
VYDPAEAAAGAAHGRASIMIRRALTVLAASAFVSSVVTIPAPVQGVDLVAPTYYVGHAVNDYALGSACAESDYLTDGDWVSDRGEGAYDSDDDAIQDAVDNAPSGSIIHICAGTYVFSDEVVLDEGDSMTFEGDGQDETILDGDDSTRILNADAHEETDNGGVLSLIDLSVIDAHATNPLNNGGAVIADSVLLERVVMSANAGAYNGGAIYAESNVSIIDSSLSENSSSQDGAALYAWNPSATVTISGSVFSSNHADGAAGAIMTSGDLSINDSVFEDNESDGFAGVVSATGDNKVVSINGATFANNVSGDIGGAAVLQNLDSLTIARSSFVGNHADEFGGAINLFNDESVVIRNTTFAGNEARGGDHFGNGNGGAIDACNIASFTSIESMYRDNVSTRYGGAIGLFGDSCVTPGLISLTGNQFVNNIASSHGGAIWFAGTLQSALRNRFVGNQSGGSGGAIFGGDCMCGLPRTEQLRGNLFLRNHADALGGAILLPGNIHRIERNKFKRNTAGVFGGAVALDNVGQNIWKLFRGNFVSRNVADLSGGGIYLSCSSLRRSALARLQGVNRVYGNQALGNRRTRAIYQGCLF